MRNAKLLKKLQEDALKDYYGKMIRRKCNMITINDSDVMFCYLNAVFKIPKEKVLIRPVASDYKAYDVRIFESCWYKDIPAEDFSIKREFWCDDKGVKYLKFGTVKVPENQALPFIKLFDDEPCYAIDDENKRVFVFDVHDGYIGAFTGVKNV